MTKRMMTCMMALAVLAVPVMAAPISVIPQPTKMIPGQGEFMITAKTTICVANEQSKDAGEMLANYLEPAMGMKLKVVVGPAADGAINLITGHIEGETRAEVYGLVVTPKRISIEGEQASGLFYGVQTLRQLLPTKIFSPTKVDGVKWTIPAVTISDAPRFGWRGLMLDASRHFQNADYVKRLLDQMAMHKLNVFHWHLVDSHGWRIEIKKYPRLCTVGGFRKQPPIGRYGGYYTQDEVRDIVKYAAARHITVVPEIEMPGHSKEATAAYPHLACQNNGKEVGYLFNYPCPAQRFPKALGSDVFCAGKETTFKFLEDVLTEVMELFPSKFIHVGGDEVLKNFWAGCPDCQKRKKALGLKGESELQSYFIKRMEKFINSKGRRMIGWDEILDGGLAPNATVMSWRGEKGGIESAKMGHDVVMTPGKPLYFDHGQSNHPSHPNHWPGREAIEEVYNYNPIPKELSAAQAKHILGCQANVWTAFIHTDEILDCQIWPRGVALAETAWCQQDAKDWAKFQPRLATHKQRLDELNISYWREPKSFGRLTWNAKQTPAEYAKRTWPVKRMPVNGVLDVKFQWAKGANGLDLKNVTLTSGTVKLSDAHEGSTGYSNSKNIWRFTLPAGAPKKGWVLSADVRGNGGTNSIGNITFGTPGKIAWRKPRIVPKLVTTTPVPHTRWLKRHAAMIAQNKAASPEVVFFGDSITHAWAGLPKGHWVRGTKSWATLFGKRAVTNMGCSGDRTQHVLWRIQNGALDGVSPKLAIVWIGTNNLGCDSVRDIYWGTQAIVDEIHKRCPKTKILLLGVSSRGKGYEKGGGPERINNLTATLNDRPYVTFFNGNYAFLDKDGNLRKDLMPDFLHPNTAGYKAFAEAIKPTVDKLLK